MTSDERLSIATLGGLGTFAGQALDAYLAAAPIDAAVSYLPSVPDLWQALDDGAIGAVMLAAATEHTGWSRTAERLISRPQAYTVLGEAIVPYRCVLAGHPGARLSSIREIRGHGSLRECAAYFSRKLPDAALNIHRANSSAALAEVEQLDASVAVVTTRAAASTTRLSVLAEHVDDGARGSWWLVGRGPVRPAAAAGTVVAVLPNHALTAAFDLLSGRGMRVRDIMSVPSGALFTSTQLIVADRVSESTAIDPGELAGLDGVLLGAFESKESSRWLSQRSIRPAG